MTIYTLSYNTYEFLFKTEEKLLEIYNKGNQEMVSEGLPKGTTWETIKTLTNRTDNIIENSELAKKILNLFELKDE